MLDDARQLEVVDASEEAQGRLPAGRVIADDRGDDGIVRE
jgi:hypothetical protein